MFVCKDVFDVLYILRNSRGEISLTEFDKASENQYLAVNRINIQPQSQWKYQTAWESDHSCSLMHQKYYSEWVWMWHYFCFIHHTGNGRCWVQCIVGYCIPAVCCSFPNEVEIYAYSNLHMQQGYYRFIIITNTKTIKKCI